LKGLLLLRNTDFRRSHDLVYLVSLLNDQSLADALLDKANVLNDYAIEPRYPGRYVELSMSDGQEAQEAIDRLASVMARAGSLRVRFSRDCTALLKLSMRCHDYCAAGVYAWSIEPNGDVTPCAGLTDQQYIAGNIRSQALEEIVTDSRIASTPAHKS